MRVLKIDNPARHQRREPAAYAKNRLAGDPGSRVIAHIRKPTVQIAQSYPAQ